MLCVCVCPLPFTVYFWVLADAAVASDVPGNAQAQNIWQLLRQPVLVAEQPGHSDNKIKQKPKRNAGQGVFPSPHPLSVDLRSGDKRWLPRPPGVLFPLQMRVLTSSPSGRTSSRFARRRMKMPSNAAPAHELARGDFRLA